MKLKSSTLVFIAVVCAIFLPVLFMQGMFMDGLIYSTVARNMTQSTEALHCFVSETYLNPFYEQPPLSMLLESVLIQAVGELFFVDRLFGFVALFISMYFLFRITQLFRAQFHFAVLPLLFFLMIPVVDWSFKNGMLENWMCAFTTSASYFLLHDLVVERRRLIHQMIAATLITAAFLTKGFPGLFPLGVPFIYNLAVQRNVQKSILDSSRFLLWFLVILGVSFLFFPSLRIYFQSYLQAQVFSSIGGNREVDGHFFILKRVPQELIPLFALSVLVYVYAKLVYKIMFSRVYHRSSTLLFLFIALSASLPIMISPKQSGYYVLCSYPFLALFFSSLLSERIHVIVSHLLQERRIKILLVASYVVIVFSLGMMIYNYKNFYRDQEKIELVDEVSLLVGNEKKLSIDWNLQSDYSMNCYFYQRHYVSTYTPNYTWVHTRMLLTTEPLPDRTLVRSYLLDNRRVYLYNN